MSCRAISLTMTAAVWLLGTADVSAHDWYPAWCCDDQDCRALAEDRGETVTEAPDGWHLWDGRVIARGYAKMSPDKKFHLCEEGTTKAIICFFAPLGGS